MIVKKITPKDIGRAVGFELMKLRWEYGCLLYTSPSPRDS